MKRLTSACVLASISFLFAGCSGGHQASSALPGAQAPSSGSRHAKSLGNTTTYTLSTSYAPEGAAVGPDGNVWFTESPLDSSSGRIGKITPGGVITEYVLPDQNSFPLSPALIAAGPGGKMWFAAFGSPGRFIGSITTDGSSISIYPYSVDAYGTAVGMIGGPDGNLWVTFNCARGCSSVAKISPSGVFLSSTLVGNVTPGEIVTGPDNNLWFTEPVSNAIGRITPSGTLTTFSAGLPGYTIDDLVSDGSALWFTARTTSQALLAKMTRTGARQGSLSIPFDTSIQAQEPLAYRNTSFPADFWVLNSAMTQVYVGGAPAEYTYTIPDSNHGDTLGRAMVVNPSDSNVWYLDRNQRAIVKFETN